MEQNRNGQPRTREARKAATPEPDGRRRAVWRELRARQARLFLAARLTRFSLPNQNIENNPMQSNKGSLAWML
jgi:predicted Fe-S protein YdhL (DUF1289 family)